MTQHAIIQQKYLNSIAQYTEPVVNELLKQLPDLKYFEYMREQTKIVTKSYNKEQTNKLYRATESEWCKVYQSIKDDSWPDCNSYNDFKLLPGWIQEECVSMHKVSPELWAEHITSPRYIIETLPIQNIVRLKHIVLDNIEYIKNKDIIDFSCNAGSNSISCMAVGAKSLVGTDVREENVKIASATGKYIGYTEDKFLVQQADIHDYALNTALCQGKHTVLLCGILYHVHDHYAIIESITKANPNHIIIETGIHPDSENMSSPVVVWEVEPNDRVDGRLHNGYYNNQENLLVGSPNDAWVELTLRYFGYKKIKLNRFLFCTENYVAEDLKYIRSVHVYERNQ